jgi:membrane fusion protein (multidrug efflux system)
MSLIYWGIMLALLLIGGIYWLWFWQFREWTNDCYVEGNQVYITPLHHGFVTSIHTDDTFLVKKGETLVELDKTDFLIEFDRAKENLAQVVREVCQKFHQVFVYRSDIEVRKAALIRDAQDFEHRLGVLAQSGVSLEDYEHAVAALRASFYALQTTETLYEQALSLVQNTSVQDHPLVAAARDRMRDAWVDLYRCTIRSPVEGLAAQRTIQVGMWVPSGTPLLSVIPLDQIWVNANFKETQLRHMRIGQSSRRCGQRRLTPAAAKSLRQLDQDRPAPPRPGRPRPRRT